MNHGIHIQQIVINTEKMPDAHFVKLLYGIGRSASRTKHSTFGLHLICQPNAECHGFQRNFFQISILHRGENKY